MPVNERGQRVKTYHHTKDDKGKKDKQKAQADELRKPKYSTGGPGVGGVMGGGAAGGGS